MLAQTTNYTAHSDPGTGGKCKQIRKMFDSHFYILLFKFERPLLAEGGR